MALIAESVENANARIRFFRVAFGAAEVEQTIGAQEVAAIVEGLGRTGRHRIDWASRRRPEDRGQARLPRHPLHLERDALGRDDPRSPHGRRLAGVGQGRRVKIDRALWDALGQPDAPIAVSSAEVEFPLARVTAARIGRTLAIETGAAEVAVSF
jgi:histidine phosphotransferase ChpT